jgi:pimeloyl-ACP methyl ester carboxylesterase
MYNVGFEIVARLRGAVALIQIEESPLAPGISPVQLYYREDGAGFPLVFLHGGWGYEIYPFNRQIRELGPDVRVLIPDRTGYGKSMHIDELPTDFHSRAATETICFLNALDIERPVLWGHSDGAVIAAKIGLAAPDRVSGLILEAFHFLRRKPGSRAFFETMAVAPADLGDRVTNTLARDHGEDYWKRIIVLNGTAWLGLADEAKSDDHDLYDGDLSSLEVPALFIHGSRDPRTEPGELEGVKSQLSSARFEIIDGGGHSPHSSDSTSYHCAKAARVFLNSIL